VRQSRTKAEEEKTQLRYTRSSRTTTTRRNYRSKHTSGEHTEEEGNQLDTQTTTAQQHNEQGKPQHNNKTPKCNTGVGSENTYGEGCEEPSGFTEATIGVSKLDREPPRM
jgi:hypothetical protein